MAERQPLLPKSQPKPSPQEVSKKREIRAKLRMYEIILALGNGYIPTTKQFTGHLHWLLRSGILEPRNRRLSVRGRNAIRDVRAWIEAIAEEAEYKNGDDEIQNFIWELKQSDIDVGIKRCGHQADLDAPDVPVTRSGVKRDSRKALKQLKTLGELIYSNSEFRKLLVDANVLFRDIVADAASKAADIASDAAHNAAKVAEDQRPSQQELNNIDKPADGGQDKDKKPPSPDEVKDQADKAGKDAKKKGQEAQKSAQKKGKKARDDIQEYLNQKFPKQRQDAVINRLKKVISYYGYADCSSSLRSRKIQIILMQLTSCSISLQSTPRKLKMQHSLQNQIAISTEQLTSDVKSSPTSPVDTISKESSPQSNPS